jgi:hypothetical protein
LDGLLQTTHSESACHVERSIAMSKHDKESEWQTREWLSVDWHVITDGLPTTQKYHLNPSEMRSISIQREPTLQGMALIMVGAMKPSPIPVFCLALLVRAGAQQRTITCENLFEPRTYQDAITASADPTNSRSAVIFGEASLVPVMRMRFIDGATNRPLQPQKITINYGWRWLNYPYPEHAWGAWTETSDRLSCATDTDGWIESPKHEVRPRGWYNGIYARVPWPKRPTFTGIEAVAVTKSGFARVRIAPRDIRKFESAVLLVRVFDGWRTDLSWGSASARE